MKHPRTNPSNNPADQQAQRINQLRAKLNELAGGHMVDDDSSHCPPDLKEQFLEQVLAFEQGEKTTLLKLLGKHGYQFPAPIDLEDSELTDALWELIYALAQVRVFLNFTDHLSDRELYTHLWEVTLHEEDVFEPVRPASAWHFDLTGAGSEEDSLPYLKYYADELSRKSWAKAFPTDPMPAHATPPYDRDQHMPKPWDSL